MNVFTGQMTTAVFESYNENNILIVNPSMAEAVVI